jgi:spermidine synthase
LDHADAHTIVFASGLIMLSVAAWHAAGADENSLWAGAAGVTTAVGTGIVVGRGALGVAGGVVLAAGLCAHLLLGRRRARDSMASLTALGLAVGTAITCVGWGGHIAHATENARWRTFSRFHLRASRDSRYQHIQIGCREGQCVLVQDGRRTAQFPERAASRARAVLLLTQHPRPRDVLVIGGGLGGLCQELLAAGVRRLDYVEPDPKLLELVTGHLPGPLAEALRDPRFVAHSMDGRRFVQRAPAQSYDLAVVNVGDPTSAADSRFYTLEFFRELRAILRPRGVAAFCGITGDENYMAGDPVQLYTACIFRTLRRVWEHVFVRPGDEFCYFAGDHATADLPLLEKRFEELGFGPEAMRHSFRLEHFPPERTEWVRNEMRAAAARAPVNTDERPVLFTLFLAVQAHYVADRGRAFPGTHLFATVRRLPPYLLWLPLAGVPLVVLALRLARRDPSRVAGALGVLGTGAFGLSAELLIIYRYQTSFGFVYRDISIIAGVFMLGLAAGGWMAGRAASPRTRSRLLTTEAGQAIFIFVLPATLGLISVSPVLFIAAALMAGWLTGSEFPLAARSGLMAGQDSAGVAGLLDAADHLGALLGAAGAGLLLLPALGTVQTAALVALLKCSTLCGLVVAFWRDGRA